MGAYYLSPVVGTGTRDDPYRPAIGSVATAWSAVIPATPDGKPAKTWSLVWAEVPAGAVLPAGVQLLGSDTALAGPVSLTSSDLTALSLLTGVNFSGLTSVGDLVHRLGMALVPGFSFGDLRAATRTTA